MRSYHFIFVLLKKSYQKERFDDDNSWYSNIKQ